MHELAQLNIARMKFAFEAPEMADFVARLDEIDALADRSPGFVWRWIAEGDASIAEEHFDADMLVNLSVWQNLASLREFVFKSNHNQVMALRKQWFERMEQACTVLWWVPQGHIPSLAEASERLQLLREQGPTPRAFSFRENFPSKNYP